MAMTLQFTQQAADQATWVGPTIAISLAVIAIALVVRSAVAVLAGRALLKTTHQIRDELSGPLESLRRIATEGEAIAGRVRGEAEHVIRASRRLRGRVEDAAVEAEERLADLGALYDVAYEEVEDTVMTLAGTLRTGRSVASTARAFLGGRSRRRRRKKLRRRSA